MIKLFTAATANSSSTGVQWDGGPLSVLFRGTWDTSTVALQVSYDGTNYVAVGATTTKTADGFATVTLPPGCYVRANLASVGASTSVTIWGLRG